MAKPLVDLRQPTNIAKMYNEEKALIVTTMDVLTFLLLIG